jgi:hypothetical protein
VTTEEETQPIEALTATHPFEKYVKSLQRSRLIYGLLMVLFIFLAVCSFSIGEWMAAASPAIVALILPFVMQGDKEYLKLYAAYRQQEIWVNDLLQVVRILTEELAKKGKDNQ